MRPPVQQVLARIEAVAAASAAEPRLVAIDGPSGSGKSTLGRAVAAHLSAPLVRIDDFVTWADFGAFWPRVEREVVRPLLAGRDAVYRVRDWAGDEFGDGLGDERTVPWAPTVVLEGVTCSRRAVAADLACRVWIEAPAPLRLERGLRRDGADHRALYARWMAEEAAFFAADGARQRADVVVSGTDPR